MRTLFVQTLRELRSIFYTPVAYVVMTLFLMMIGANFYTAISLLNGRGAPTSIIEATFVSIPFIFIFSVTTAAITMRSFAEEYRMGTIELLTTAPIHEWQIVAAKFISAVFFYVIIFAPTVIFIWIFRFVSDGAPVAKSSGAVASTYLVLLLIGALFISIGLLASSLVRDQVNAAVISLVANIVFIFLPLMLPYVFPNLSDAPIRKAIEFISPISHLRGFTKGIVDTRQVIWYVSASLFVLVLTNHIFHSRKLKS